MKKIQAVLLIAFLIASGALLVHSQYDPGLAPLDAMDTLNEGPVGPDPSRYMDMARPGAPPPPRRPQSREYVDDGYYEDSYYLEPQIEATPTPEMVKVLTGQRVRCTVCGDLLEDVFYAEEIKENVVTNPDYRDDGVPPDESPGDLIYTHKIVGTERSDVIGPACYAQRRHLFKVLQYATYVDPMRFYGLYVTSKDEFSKLYRDKMESELSFREIDVIDKVMEWLTDRAVIKNFRIPGAEDDPMAPLIPLFIPSPPYIPKYEVPTGFNPIREQMGMQEGQPGYQSEYYEDDYYG